VYTFICELRRLKTKPCSKAKIKTKTTEQKYRHATDDVRRKNKGKSKERTERGPDAWRKFFGSWSFVKESL
jgi:hypothetical protein